MFHPRIDSSTMYLSSLTLTLESSSIAFHNSLHDEAVSPSARSLVDRGVAVSETGSLGVLSLCVLRFGNSGQKSDRRLGTQHKAFSAHDPFRV